MTVTSTGLRSRRYAASRWASTVTSTRPDDVVVEEPLTVHVEQRGVRAILGSTMRTPGDDLELALGLAMSEGVVQTIDQVATVSHCRGEGRPEDNDVVIRLRGAASIDGLSLGRVTRPTSACGMCGRDDIDRLIASRPAAWRCAPPPPGVLGSLPDRMRGGQKLFRRTGGLHAAALANADGGMLCVREDVGRHNAVDKVIGHALTTGIEAAALVVSGRAGFEIVQKAVMAGIPALVSVSATTALAIDAARASGLTLAAFAREGRMTVYHAPHWAANEGQANDAASS